MIKDLLKKNREFWTHDRSISALLIYLLASLFIWVTFSRNLWMEFIIRDILFNLIIIAGVFAVLTFWRHQIPLIILASITILVRLFSSAFPFAWLEIFTNSSSLIFFIVLVWLQLQHVFKAGPINFYRVQAAIVIYILIGFIWAFVYNLIFLFNPESFDFLNRPIAPDLQHTYSHFLYFSFITLTTLGFGDIVPVADVARSFVVFEGMIGMLYPVVMIARLVSLEVEHKKQHQPPGHP
jgi:hypothetical protein